MVCRETEDIRQAAAELPWVCGPDVLLLVLLLMLLLCL